MNRELYESYIMTYLELGILLNRMGCENVLGFPENFGLDYIDEKVVYESVSEMINRDFLHMENESLCIDSKIRKIVQVIVNSERALEFVKNYEGYARYMCYLDKNYVVILTDSITRAGMITIGIMDNDCFYNQFLSDILPNTYFKIDESKINLEKEKVIKDYIENDLLIKEILIEAKGYSNNSQISKSVIIDNQCDRYILQMLGNSIVRFSYNNTDDFIKLIGDV